MICPFWFQDVMDLPTRIVLWYAKDINRYRTNQFSSEETVVSVPWFIRIFEKMSDVWIVEERGEYFVKFGG